MRRSLGGAVALGGLLLAYFGATLVLVIVGAVIAATGLCIAYTGEDA